MLGNLLWYAVHAVAFIPAILAVSSYSLVVLSFCSIATHSVRTKLNYAGQRRIQRASVVNESSAIIVLSRKVSNLKTKFFAFNPNDNRDIFTRSGLQQDDVILHICSFLTLRSVTTLSCVNQSTYKIISDNDTLSHSLWQSLWFRDYGTVLLRWKTAREAIFKSIMAIQNNTETLLSSSTNLDAMVIDALISENTQEFYFHFQLAFIDYILAGHNNQSRCLLGLHGHIFDFTEFAPHHPGLSKPVLIECGRDVTALFEDVRHSRTARSIALKLCLIVDRSYCNNRDDDCGLYRPSNNVENMAAFLSQTNTRPPLEDPNEEMTINGILPMKPRSLTWQQPRTLQRFRMQHAHGRNKLALAKQYKVAANTIRPYYDPFANKWKGWYTKLTMDSQWKTIHVDFDT